MDIVICSVGEEIETSIAEVLEKLGYEIYVFRKAINDQDYDLEYLQALVSYIDEKSIDMVWSIGYLPIISRVCSMKHKIYISWIIREFWNTLYSDTIKNSINYIFIGEETVAKQFYKNNPGHIFYLSPGAAIKDVNIMPDTVGLCFLDTKYPIYYLKDDSREYLKGYIRGMVEAQKRVYGYHFLPKLLTKKFRNEIEGVLSEEDKGKDYTKKAVSDMIDDFLCDTITKDERDEVVKLIENLGIYKINTGISQINVNITSRKWKTGIPYDILRIMGAGGFLLTNYQPGMEEYFCIDDEIVLYEDNKDLIDKIKYYMSHEEERGKIAYNGKKKVEELYTLEHRIADMFYLLSEAF